MRGEDIFESHRCEAGCWCTGGVGKRLQQQAELAVGMRVRVEGLIKADRGRVSVALDGLNGKEISIKFENASVLPNDRKRALLLAMKDLGIPQLPKLSEGDCCASDAPNALRQYLSHGRGEPTEIAVSICSFIRRQHLEKVLRPRHISLSKDILKMSDAYLSSTEKLRGRGTPLRFWQIL